MQEIEDLAVETYQKNIEYISKNHKELMKTLNIFEMALQKGDYTQEFELEYIDGYFDIKIAKSGYFLYPNSAKNLTKEILKIANYRKDFLTFEGFPLYNFSEHARQNPTPEIGFLLGILPLMDYYRLNTQQSDSMKSISKYICIGVGQGNHIARIHKKVSAAHYFIIEDSLELFKLSLFSTPYYEMAESAELYFSVADDENIFLKTIYNFLESDFFDNRFLKYTYFPSHSHDKLKQVQNALSTQSFIFFPYKAELEKYLRPLEYLNDGYNTLNLATNFKTSFFSDKPTLIIAAGPSFGKNIEWLKKNHDKFFIIAVSAVLNTLHKHNIAPDIVAQLDGDIMTLGFYKTLLETNFLQNTLVFFGANVHKDIRKLFPKEQIFNYEEGAAFIKNFGSISTPCVGSFSIMLALMLNCEKIYLLGLDLALNQETGETHSSEHLYSLKTNMQEKNEFKNIMCHTTNIFPVQGNFIDLVYTNALLHTSIQSLYHHIPNYKKENQTIYNLNEGAKINKTVPLRIEDIAVATLAPINKKEFFTASRTLFETLSVKVLSQEDTLSLKKRVSDAIKTQEIIAKYANDVSHANSNKYLYDLLGLVSDILHQQSREERNLAHVFLVYFKYALPLVIDLFNIKGLKNEKRHIKKIDKMIQDEMRSVCAIYIKSLEEFIQTKC